jgi:hypothetical protein
MIGYFVQYSIDTDEIWHYALCNTNMSDKRIDDFFNRIMVSDQKHQTTVLFIKAENVKSEKELKNECKKELIRKLVPPQDFQRLYYTMLKNVERK